jgi:phosphate transport system protein
MSKHMQRDLEKLQKLVLKMAGLVEESVFQAAKSLQDRDVELADQVVEGDNLIDELENDVQEECLKILALHQPVAVDLRRISSVLLISTDLERIGDLATGIAERVAVLARPPLVTIPERTRAMADRTIQMVRKSLDAFVNSDAVAARTVIKLDDEVDADNQAILRDVIAEMKRTPELIDTLMSLFSAIRHLERIADHATNISEDVIYLVEGAIVRHHHELLGV